MAASDDVAALSLLIDAHYANFEAKRGQGAKPSAEDLAAVPEWLDAHLRKRKAEKEAAPPPREGGCQYYIVRRRRYCSNMASEASADLCCYHQEQRGKGEGEEEEEGEGDGDGERVGDGERDGEGSEVGSREVIDLSGKKKKRLDRRMKKMTNPLAIQYSTPAPAVDWAAVFTDPSLPLFLDIGCSKGRFLHNLAQSTAYERDHGGKWNFCGVEIYDSLVRAANATFKTPNLHYISANINTSCRSLQFPAQLRRVSIQFPDPWFEEKKKIRRVVNADLAAWLSDALPGGGVGEVYICSDVLELAVEMKAILLATGAFALHSLHSPLSALEPSLEWLPSRPWQVPTERDVVCEINWRPVYRALLTRL